EGRAGGAPPRPPQGAGPAARPPRPRHEPAHRLREGVQPRLCAPRSFGTEGGDGAVDEPRVHGGEGDVVDAELLRDAVAIAFEDDVGGLDQAIEGLATGPLLE